MDHVVKSCPDELLPSVVEAALSALRDEHVYGVDVVVNNFLAEHRIS